MGSGFSRWPARLLLPCEWGCAVEICLDCTGGQVLRVAPVQEGYRYAVQKGNPTTSRNKRRATQINIEVAKKELENALPPPFEIPGNSGHIPGICDTRHCA